jgi:hypothetical protein
MQDFLEANCLDSYKTSFYTIPVPVLVGVWEDVVSAKPRSLSGG